MALMYCIVFLWKGQWNCSRPAILPSLHTIQTRLDALDKKRTPAGKQGTSRPLVVSCPLFCAEARKRTSADVRCVCTSCIISQMDWPLTAMTDGQSKTNKKKKEEKERSDRSEEVTAGVQMIDSSFQDF